ncbi:MAG TPA: phosphoribosylformimino-5-aminoimidazole carboxamide ribotide isomerase [Lachnospiraceae bacterium]|nr:phosphoribosylformimino-5-aminoimidazole carboxamide ribotide isomerase [Lachnospiraceae bacterium]
MRFRPCIDIHNGRVKQIVGSSLTDSGNDTRENYVSDKDAAYYAGIYKENGLSGGHIAMLNVPGTGEYELTRAAALKALAAYPGGLQIGGGINAANAASFIEAGASHIIVTSYVFRDGRIDMDRLTELKETVGRDRLVLDLSCRKKDDGYYIVTDRWQKFTGIRLIPGIFDELSVYCDEFLVHAVDVEGKKSGIDIEVLDILSRVPYTVTYAGGISTLEDIEVIKRVGRGCVDFTVGSALSLFGGTLKMTEVLECIR